MSRVPIRSQASNSPREVPRKPLVTLDDFIIFLMILPTILAALIHFFKSAPSHEPSCNRQIILDVPRTSQVDAQVTSGNNTVNLKNL